MSEFRYYSDGGGRRKKTSSAGRIFVVLLLLGLAAAATVYFLTKKAPHAKPVQRPAQSRAVKQEAPALSIDALLAPGTNGKSSASASEVKIAPKALAAKTAPIRAALDAKDPVLARKLALEALADKSVTQDSAPYRTLAKLLGEANLYILDKGVPCPQVERYAVRSGDSLYTIAIKFNLPVEAIRAANGLAVDNPTIHPGQVLKIYKGAWRIEVGKKACLLRVYDGDTLFKIYDIGIGREGRTPTGAFKIADKIKNPPWYAPDGRVVPFGDKENVLGTRWFKLQPTGETDPYNIGYGIHGTWDEGSITQPLSNGCVRMRNAEVEELFNYIPRQTPVVITE